MKYLHTMIRVRDIDASLRFFCEGLGLKEMRRMENAAGKFTLLRAQMQNNNWSSVVNSRPGSYERLDLGFWQLCLHLGVTSSEKQSDGQDGCAAGTAE